MILTISGLHGTGKSVIAKLIAENLGIRYYSTGYAFRDLAKEMNMTLKEFTKYVENHPEIDNILDKKIIEIANMGNVIIDSQLSGYFLNKIADFKILLTCPLEIRIRRMAQRDGTSYEENLKETILREKSELKRFKELYNIDISDIDRVKETYNLILATEGLTIEEVLNNVLNDLKNKNLIKS